MTTTGAGARDIISMLLEEMTFPAPPTAVRWVLSEIHEEDPETLEVAYRLINNGSEDARDTVRNAVKLAVRQIGRARADHGDIDWRLYCEDARSPHLKQKFLSKWNYLQIIDQTHPDGVERYRNGVEHQIIGMHLSLYSGTPEDGDHTDARWRGLAALYVTGVSPFAYQKEHAPHFRSFVDYAGKHADLARVVHLSIERNLIDPEALEAIIALQDKSLPALHEGVI